MPLLSSVDQLDFSPSRALIAGVSGSGKSSLCRRLSRQLGLAYVELDSLFHGPNWSVLPTFELEVERFIAGDRWVTEWQYDGVRERLLARTQLLIWLDYPLHVVMSRVVLRTLLRELTHQPLWNGNAEPPFLTILNNPEHIVRWAWRTRSSYPPRIRDILVERPQLPILRLTHPSQADEVVVALERCQRSSTTS